MAIGIFCVESASGAEERKPLVQLFACILGIISMILIAFWDYRSLIPVMRYIYFLSIFLLILVFLFGIGKEETGALSWIRFGSIGIQPSEFVKLFFCLYYAWDISQNVENKTLNKAKPLVKTILSSVLIIGLVVLQNDTGTALVFIFMLFTMLYISGIYYKYILWALVASILLMPILWLFLADYQRARIAVFFNPNTQLSDAGYQVSQSKLAFGSGGILGHGYKNGPINSLSYLPEKDTDFIFGVIGEEFGFIGSIFVVILLLILIFRCFQIAKYAPDINGRLIAVGVASMLMFHTIENIGMTIGILPVTGIPLPFISYGGSSVLAMSMAIGLILSVRRKTYNLHFI